MTLLAILKVNRANRLLVLEKKLELRKNVSTIDKISLLVRQHYCGWLRNPAPPKGYLKPIHNGMFTWWLIPLSKWVITPVIEWDK